MGWQRIISAVTGLGVVLGLVLAAPSLETGGEPDAAHAATRAAAPPEFSPPLWWPLRNESRIGCVKDNCVRRGAHYHGEWAMDMIGKPGDPVYAAGYGRVEVKVRGLQCPNTGDGVRGNWVQVDHGGGQFTLYYHLGEILVSDGQRVTPNTQLATMGQSGRCKGTYYLHFERREGGHLGDPVYMGNLRSCVAGRQVLLPGHFGYSSWNGYEPFTTGFATSGNACALSAAEAALDRPARPTGKRINSTSASISTAEIPGAERYAVEYARWIPSQGKWAVSEFRYAPQPTWRLDNLKRAKKYRFRVAALSTNATSTWSARRVVKLAAKPGRPGKRMLRVNGSSVWFGWRYPRTERPIERYRVVLQKKRGSKYRTVNKTLVEKGTSINFRLGAGKYRVKVRAKSDAGWGRWQIRRFSVA